MMEAITTLDAGARMITFISVLVLMVLLESLFPRKQRVQPRQPRWLTNLGLVFIDSVVVRLVLPVAAIGVAEFSSDKGWGLLNMLSGPAWLEIIVAIVVLDMLIYWQHVASHLIPALWRVHQVHHLDRDIDTTTGVRFHPIEILLSMLFKMACVLALGPAAVAVFLFEVILNASAMFNHANVHLPKSVDRLLRCIIVTPDMHRVHHSVNSDETNSNYGFNLSVWDRLFGSYIAQPAAGHKSMIIGLPGHQSDKPSSLRWCLMRPVALFLRGRVK